MRDPLELLQNSHGLRIYGVPSMERGPAAPKSSFIQFHLGVGMQLVPNSNHQRNNNRLLWGKASSQRSPPTGY